VALIPSIGSLRHRISHQTPPATPDGFGGLTGSWRTATSGIPAKIGPTRGGEEVRAGRMSGINTFDIVVRSTSATRAITPKDRLRDDSTGLTYNVAWVGNLDERDRFLTITCSAGGLTDG
jgi:head-tail adaptor